MSGVKCPNCGAKMPSAEVASGWCEACGKQLPVSMRPDERRLLSPERAAEEQSAGRKWFNGWRVFLCFFGVGFLVYGYSEWRVSVGTSEVPSVVDLAELEAGMPLPQNHIRIGPHVRLYQHTIYSIDLDDENKPDATINYAFYPIISRTNPVFEREEAYEKAKKAGENPPVPQVDNLKVLVKVKRKLRVRELPDSHSIELAVMGVVINQISSLGTEEASLIRSQLPLIDTDTLLILEEGKKPAGLAYALGHMIGGAVLCLPLLFWMFSRKQAEA